MSHGSPKQGPSSPALHLEADMLALVLAIVALVLAVASFFITRKIEALAGAAACLAIVYLLAYA